MDWISGSAAVTGGEACRDVGPQWLWRQREQDDFGTVCGKSLCVTRRGPQQHTPTIV
jgi:hypothetical protein